MLGSKEVRSEAEIKEEANKPEYVDTAYEAYHEGYTTALEWIIIKPSIKSEAEIRQHMKKMHMQYPTDDYDSRNYYEGWIDALEWALDSKISLTMLKYPCGCRYMIKTYETYWKMNSIGQSLCDQHFKLLNLKEEEPIQT